MFKILLIGGMMSGLYQDVKPNDITHKDFDAEGWPQLIGKLLYLEASVCGIPIDCLSFCYKTKKDGGIDLLANNIATSSNHINSPATIYACKAYEYTKGKIDSDLKPFSTKDSEYNFAQTREGNWGLKQQFKDLMQNGAHLTWVIKHSITPVNSSTIKEETINVIKNYYNIDVSLDRIHVYNAERILEWVNDRTRPILSTLARQYVRAFLGYPESDYVVPLWQWLRDTSFTSDFSSIYYFDEHFNGLKSRVIDYLFKDSPSLFMLVSGLSAIGKTHFIRWTLTEHLHTLDEDLKSMVEARTIYYNWDIPDKALINGLISLKDMIVIIDNCTTDIAQDLYRRRSIIACKLVLITSDLEIQSKLIHDVEHIFLNPEECVGAVNKYLDSQTLKPVDKEIIRRYSHGFMCYADSMFNELIGEGEQSNILSVAQEISERILRKVFINSDYKDEKLYLPVLQACALFSEFGWDDDGRYHSDLNWIVENLVHFPNSVQDRLRVTYHVCRIGYEHKIFERRGSYLSLRPMPLAYMLVSKYLSNLNPSEKIALISSADDSELAESMARQFAHYSQMPESTLVVERILDSQYADFSVRNPIFEKKGARVFLALLNVHPAKCLDILKRCYENLTLETIKGLKETRSYIVSALRKLVFSKLYFHDAIEILYRHAQAETEDWSNIATELLTQLFQILLPGTEVALTERMRVLKKWYTDSDNQTIPIILKILDRSIRTSHFFRHGGNERFGSGPSFDEYNNIEWGEGTSYIKESLEMLKHVMETQPLFRQAAIDIVVKEIESLVHGSMWFLFNDVFPYSIWQEESLKGVHDQLSRAIHYKRADEETLHKVDEYKKMLFQDPIRLKITDLVVSPNHTSFDPTQIELKLEEFVKELIHQHIDLKPYIYLVTDGYPREGYRFGRVVSANDYHVLDLANAFLDVAKKQNNINFAFIKGLAMGMNAKDKATIYSRLLVEPELQPYSFEIISSSNASIKDIHELFSLIPIVKRGVANFIHFAYGSALEHLDISCHIEFVNRLLEYGTIGKQVALEIINMDVLGDMAFFNSYYSILDDILFDKCLFEPSELNRDISFGWGKLMLLLLKHHPRNSKRIAEYVSDLYRSMHDDNNSLKHDVKKIFAVLSTSHFIVFWKSFSSLLMDEDPMLRIRFKFDFGWFNGRDKAHPILSSSDNSHILNWCITNGVDAAAKVISIIQLYHEVDEEVVWDDLALSLIKQYNSSSVFLSSLTANLGSYSSFGSGVNMIKRMIELYKFLLKVDEVLDKTWIREQIAAREKQAEYLQQRHEESFLGYDY